MTDLESLTTHLSILHSSINVGVVRDGDEALLIDCDDASAIEALVENGLTPGAALLTHYHRDTAGGIHRLAADGVPIIVSEGVESYVEDAEAIWRDPTFHWHRYMFRPQSLLPTRSIPVSGTIAPGDSIDWGPATITAIQTPGHTEYGLSYRVAVDGERHTFCGDALAGDGRLVDVYSLQRGLGEHRDYHEFLGDRRRYREGLDRLVGDGPVIPARGDPIPDPGPPIRRLQADLEAVYRNYARTSAFRHYNPDHFDDIDDVDFLTFADPRPVPDPARHVGTTWLLEADSGEHLVMDCGSTYELDAFEEWGLTEAALEACWISHYHDDHTGELPALTERYGCSLLAPSEVAAVVEHPEAYRLPGLAPIDVSIDRRLASGDRWTWHDWTLTNYWFPGQTHYHGALLAEREDLRLLFAGDAFTPTGIDDYCTHNRNLLGPDRGYRRCLDLLASLEPTHVFNSHLEAPFAVRSGAIRAVRRSLARRASLLDRLTLGHPNAAIDPQWVCCRPYRQRLRPGEPGTIRVAPTNYTDHPRPVAIRPRLGPLAPAGVATGDWRRDRLPPGGTASIPVEIRMPDDPSRDRFVLPVDVRWRGHDRLRYREAVVTVAD